MEIKIYAEGVQLAERSDKILQAAAKPIDAPGHDDIELTARSGRVQGVEGWAFVSTLGATDVVVLVDIQTFTTSQLCLFYL